MMLLPLLPRPCPSVPRNVVDVGHFSFSFGAALWDTKETAKDRETLFVTTPCSLALKPKPITGPAD